MSDAANHRLQRSFDSKSRHNPLVQPSCFFCCPSPTRAAAGHRSAGLITHMSVGPAPRNCTTTTTRTAAQIMGAKTQGEPAKWTGPGRDAVSRAWPRLASTAWRGLLSQLGLSPQAVRGAFNPEAHHHRSTRSSRRTRVAKSSRDHPVLLDSFASPYLAVSVLFCRPARRLPTSSHHCRSPCIAFASTTRRHHLSRHRYRPSNICAAVPVDT